MLPMLSPEVGPKSVSGIQVGPSEAVVRKSVVFQTPPLAPPMKTVLPEGSEGSTAIALPVPVIMVPLAELVIPAGPIEVHVSLESRFEAASSKIRKLAVA